MLQLLHVDISKVDRVLHLIPCFLLPRLSVSSSSSQHRLGIRRPSPFLDASDVQGGAGPMWTRKKARKTVAGKGI
jgi:hypothetical protein